MTGEVVQVNISQGGVPKLPVPLAKLTPFGIEGDRWAHPSIHGGPRKAVLLIASEVIGHLVKAGFPVAYGSLGENITTRGLDPRQMRVGHAFRVGNARIELTKLRVPCATLEPYGAGIQKQIFDNLARVGDPSSPVWGWSGFYAAVTEPGLIQAGDIISLEAALA